jgi:hypothetical protein
LRSSACRRVSTGDVQRGRCRFQGWNAVGRPLITDFPRGVAACSAATGASYLLSYVRGSSRLGVPPHRRFIQLHPPEEAQVHRRLLERHLGSQSSRPLCKRVALNSPGSSSSSARQHAIQFRLIHLLLPPALSASRKLHFTGVRKNLAGHPARCLDLTTPSAMCTPNGTLTSASDVRDQHAAITSG